MKKSLIFAILLPFSAASSEWEVKEFFGGVEMTDGQSARREMRTGPWAVGNTLVTLGNSLIKTADTPDAVLLLPNSRLKREAPDQIRLLAGRMLVRRSESALIVAAGFGTVRTGKGIFFIETTAAGARFCAREGQGLVRYNYTYPPEKTWDDSVILTQIGNNLRIGEVISKNQCISMDSRSARTGEQTLERMKTIARREARRGSTDLDGAIARGLPLKKNSRWQNLYQLRISAWRDKSKINQQWKWLNQPFNRTDMIRQFSR